LTLYKSIPGHLSTHPSLLPELKITLLVKKIGNRQSKTLMSFQKAVNQSYRKARKVSLCTLKRRNANKLFGYLIEKKKEFLVLFSSRRFN
jgi:hypothetical protein